MFPRWLWFNHIPAGLDLTTEQVTDVRRLVREMGPGQRRFTDTSRRMLKYLAPRMTALMILFCLWIWWLVAARPTGSAMALLNTAGIVLFNLLIWVVIARSINRSIAPLVWQALNRIDIRVCESCGYILHHHPADTRTCPECGTERSTEAVSVSDECDSSRKAAE